MLDVPELRQGHLDTYAYFFTKVIDPLGRFPLHIKPAGTYAVAYLKGITMIRGNLQEAVSVDR